MTMINRGLGEEHEKLRVVKEQLDSRFKLMSEENLALIKDALATD